MFKDRRSVRDRLLDIQVAISRARSAVGRMTAQELSENWMSQFAAERAIEIISEASQHIPEDLRATEPGIPWRDVADMGNVLRHVYEKVDSDVVWAVVRLRLGELRRSDNATSGAPRIKPLGGSSPTCFSLL